MTQPALPQTQTLEREQTLTTLEQMEQLVPYEDDGKGDRKAHIINPPLNQHIWRVGMSSKDVVDIARITGQFVVALCGHRWIPRRNPEDFPICDRCLTIANQLIEANGG